MSATTSPAGLKASLEAKQWAKKRADATRAAEAKRLARSRNYLTTHSLSQHAYVCTGESGRQLLQRERLQRRQQPH